METNSVLGASFLLKVNSRLRSKGPITHISGECWDFGKKGGIRRVTWPCTKYEHGPVQGKPSSLHNLARLARGWVLIKPVGVVGHLFHLTIRTGEKMRMTQKPAACKLSCPLGVAKDLKFDHKPKPTLGRRYALRPMKV